MENIEYTIPQDEKVEKKVLAEMVANPDLVPLALGVLSEECFTGDECKAIYATLVKMYEARETIDLVTVSQKVNKPFFYANILPLDSYATEVTIMAHCETLRSLLRRRRLFFSCMEGLKLCSLPFENDDEIASFPEKMAGELEKDNSNDGTQSIIQAINNLGTTLQSGVARRCPIGLPSVERLTYGGFAPGNLVVLAARPSVGKTAVMLQMARFSASQGFPTLALSLEMTNEELAQRMILSTGCVNAGDFVWGKIDWEDFERAAGCFNSSPLFLDDTPQTLDEVCSRITLACHNGQCKIAFIDYLQLMSSSEKNDSLYRQVTEMTKRLKKLAKRLKIPIVLLCQLNRNNVSENRPPQMHDLRDSGSIEQDADIILMLDRLKNEQGEFTQRVNMYVRKNRGGLAGNITIELESDPTYTNFKEV